MIEIHSLKVKVPETVDNFHTMQKADITYQRDDIVEIPRANVNASTL